MTRTSERPAGPSTLNQDLVARDLTQFLLHERSGVRRILAVGRVQDLSLGLTTLPGSTPSSHLQVSGSELDPKAARRDK